MIRRPHARLLASTLLLSPLTIATAFAADVVVAPATASSFVVKDASAATDRLRVTEAGVVSMPSVPTATAQAMALCTSVTGVVGPCSANAGFTLPYAGTSAVPGFLFSVIHTGAANGDIPIRGFRGSSTLTPSSSAGILGENSSGSGVLGLSDSGAGIFGRSKSGNAGVFSNTSATSTAHVVSIDSNGLGYGLNVLLSNPSNGARGIFVDQQGVGPGIFAISAGGNAVQGLSQTTSAAAVLGDNTSGEVIVGRGSSGGPGVGAVVGRQDGQGGYGVRGFVTHTNVPSGGAGVSVGVLGQAGISGGINSIAGKFENVNAANTVYVLESAGNGTGAGLLVRNTNAAATDMAIFTKGAANVARIDSTGKGFFNGGTQTGGADVAELIPHVGVLPVPGDVVMIDADNPMHYRVANEANSAAVAGVITTKPGVLMNAGVENVGDAPALALVGRVPVKVTDEGGAIRAGDLLVSASTAGHAMKAPAQPTLGSVIGKALQPHHTGSGVVEMLVMLR
ncbi:MAG: hypothetical protein RLZZ502_499 [Pseudomonadota bacterium]